MAYLLDSNIFIQAKNEYYGFDICPGFWDWLEQKNKTGHVYSIDRVAIELGQGKDELSAWAKRIGNAFFLSVDEQTSDAVKDHVVAAILHHNYKSNAQTLFFRGADPFLIAYAFVHGHTVVTHESYNANQTNRINIPALCHKLSVHCIRTFDLLRTENARFVLSTSPNSH